MFNPKDLTPRFAARLIDRDYYSAQAGQAFTDGESAFLHFVAEGQARNLNPSPFFYTEWYRWQNSTAKFASALHHFVERAAFGPIDPAPFIDSVAFLAANPAYTSILSVLIALTERRDTSVSKNLDDHLSHLALRQQSVHSSIRSSVIRMQPTVRKRLVWVQAGAGFSTTKWFRPDAPRSWDLMCIWYTLAGLDLSHGEIHLRQSGTKSTAIHHVLRNDPAFLERYDQILFLDDDLTVDHPDIDRLFDIAAHGQLDLFQASLLPESYCVWPDLFRKSKSGIRKTTGVEIMMPGFTRAALFSSRDIFGRSVSGFGLDFMLSERLRQAGGKIGVVDAVAFGHFSKIDEIGGAYYRLMRALGINQKLELFSAIQELGKLPTFHDI